MRPEDPRMRRLTLRAPCKLRLTTKTVPTGDTGIRRKLNPNFTVVHFGPLVIRLTFDHERHKGRSLDCPLEEGLRNAYQAPKPAD
jgi:hypothetical protein